jgi:hypothetical protein
VDDTAIYRIQIANQRLELLAILKDFRITSLFQSTMNLGPDDSPVLLPDAGIEEIYALGLFSQK